MKIKNFIFLFSFLTFGNSFQIYALDTLDETEKSHLRPIAVVSYDGKDEGFEMSRAGINHPKTTYRFNQGDVIKTTYGNTGGQKTEGPYSLRTAAYIITRGAQTRIMEYAWVEKETLLAQVYISMKSPPSPSQKTANLEYVKKDGVFLGGQTLGKFLRLTLHVYDTYSGVKDHVLTVIVPPRDYLFVSQFLQSREHSRAIRLVSSPPMVLALSSTAAPTLGTFKTAKGQALEEACPFFLIP